MEFLSLAFMQRALLAALLAGVTSPAIGSYIVQRRLSLLGDGLGHVAIAGVGLALATGTAPLPVAVATAIVGAVIIELLRQSGKASADVAMAILFYGGLATGVLLAGLVGQGTGTLSNFLFGSLLSITEADLWIIFALAAVILITTIGLMPQLFAVCTDEDFAKVMGLPVRAYNLLIVVLAAITVTVSMRTVGLLMVSALMVVPVATASNLLTGFRRSFFLAMALGVIAAVAGVIGSYYLNAPPGSLIVVITIAGFVLSLPLAAGLKRWRQHEQVIEITDRAPFLHETTRPHEGHSHGPDCGHRAVIHGDHTDYIHDGHRHAPHGDHYDEH
ncbi:MAG: metal ABC transporter permease [Propionicimonas sp.]|uniref:metal ABC transporter permease n=1 Tax=Propionicimonas sp. TaxID=1955623 RepID=UPI001E0A0D78|nr:metal ABC transporter permease [Propionicimonas sp.]MBU4187336.1 metal ABC transporter permease [Actinomycetota bacterium]MBU4205340.1 metal ABC transporter permease [Actinomycetota bacterium]MBU4411095.1 metal ABC transporter permease [Actinomycetota bacterium]MBU4416153.1 metal ABC transporter permease [Actinomycetota bacterium]MCG2804597.1 metal ABC transporter permease [Propionicimonas sp.]